MFYNKKLISSFFLLFLFILESNGLIISRSAHAFVYNQMCSKKQLNHQIEANHKIQQLIQISDAHSQCLTQLQQQLSENQQDLDILRGCIQDIQHHISEIMHEQKKICNKLNQILNDNNIQLFNNNNNNNTKQLMAQKNFKIDTNKNFDYEKLNNNSDFDYKTAVGLVLEKKQYVQAIQTFQDFIKNYPQSHYQPNAYYWLGQLYYNQEKKQDASYYFAWVVKNYPKSSKASDALLKIGIIMQETNQTDKAKIIYRQISTLYPNSDSAKQAQKRLAHL